MSILQSKSKRFLILKISTFVLRLVKSAELKLRRLLYAWVGCFEQIMSLLAFIFYSCKIYCVLIYLLLLWHYPKRELLTVRGSLKIPWKLFYPITEFITCTSWNGNMLSTRLVLHRYNKTVQYYTELVFFIVQTTMAAIQKKIKKLKNFILSFYSRHFA